ncbi:MAG TPA: phospholipase D-like domain-containing protein, partial [Acidimicrobiales bacterium]|nr:phospholipase D-like domain-containing protein [Acidimicrobiales bacterium]
MISLRDSGRRRSGGHGLALAAATLAAVALAGASLFGPVLPAGAGAAPAGTARRVRAAAPAAAGATAPMHLIVEPTEGMGPIYSLLGSAKKSLDLVMYELVDPRVDGILAAEAARGVSVRVLLDAGYEREANTPAFDYLAAHKVSVHWSSSRFEITHEKSFVVDDRTAVVMTLNFTDRYYATTRDFAVVDEQPADVSAIAATFDIDWSSSSAAAPRGEDLLWSPGSSAALVALIDS